MKAYEHQDRWVNRMVLGDSLVVMNSLLQYEGLGKLCLAGLGSENGRSDE